MDAVFGRFFYIHTNFRWDAQLLGFIDLDKEKDLEEG